MAQETKTLTAKQKRALAVFREGAGALTPEKRLHNKQVRTDRKALTAQLAEGPATVVQLSKATGVGPSVVLWHIASLRKYGQVSEAGEEGDYILYQLTESDPDSQSQSEQE